MNQNTLVILWYSKEHETLEFKILSIKWFQSSCFNPSLENKLTDEKGGIPRW